MLTDKYEKHRQLDKQVFEYQKTRSTELAEQVINYFTGFINNYISLLKYGKVDVRNKSINQFIWLCSRNPLIKSVKFKTAYRRPLIAINTKNEAYNIHRLYLSYTVDDIYHDLIAIILEMALRYSPKKQTQGGFFHQYVYKAYHYNAFNRFKQLLFSYPTGVVQEIDKDPDWDWISTLADAQYIIGEPQKGELDDNWINGATCNSWFKEFTPWDRRILVLKYENHLTDQEIADKLLVCRATVNRSRLSCEAKIKQRRTQIYS